MNLICLPSTPNCRYHTVTLQIAWIRSTESQEQFRIMLFTPRKLIPGYLLFLALPFSSLTAGLSPVPRLLIISQTECLEGVSGPEPRPTQQSPGVDGGWNSLRFLCLVDRLGPPAAGLPGSRSGLSKPEDTQEQPVCVSVGQQDWSHTQTPLQGGGLGREPQVWRICTWPVVGLLQL